MRKKKELPFLYLTLNSILTIWWSRQKLKQRCDVQFGIPVSYFPPPTSKLWALVKLVNHFENESYHMENLDNTSYRFIDSMQQAFSDCFLYAKDEVVTEIE